MQKSETIGQLAKALAMFHLKVETVKKDATNPFFKSKYASLSNILDAVSVPLSECDLSFSQLPNGEYGLTTILMHAESGEYISADYTMKPIKDDPQGKGSVITYQRRYALSAILGLNIDEDDDGNAASKPPQNKTGPAKKESFTPNHKGWQDAVKSLSSGTVTILQIENKYLLTASDKEKLVNEASAAL